MKALFFSFLLLLCGLWASAQTLGNNLSLPNVIQPAPQSAALGRYGEIPVSVHTGVPNISIPLCTVSSGKLSVPISISYHASGVKVMDMASATGMGWALNAGADITRVVQGFPDEGTYGFPTIRMPDPNDPSLLAKEKCLSNNICNSYNNSINAWDGQPDLFYYSLIDRSGQFMLKNMISNAQPLGFMTVPYTPIQINSSLPFRSFEITDEDGTQYFFAPCDSTESYTSSSVSQWHQYYTTAWHCVKILSAEKTDSITFKYGTVSNISYSTNNSQMLQLLYDSYGNPHTFQWHTTPASTTLTKEYLLSEIDFNNGKVTLDYGTGYAAGQTMILNAIHLFNLQNGSYNELKRFTFYHSVFMNGSTSSNESRLDSLRFSGYYNTTTPVNEPVYAFNYYNYNSWQIPPFNNYGQDFWGYFNGKTANADMVFVGEGTDASGSPIAVSNSHKRLPDSNYMKIGTLQSIKYPTGGTTVFDLEPNQISTQVTPLDTTHHYTSLYASISTFGVLPNDASTFSYTFKDTVNYKLNSGGTNAQLSFQINPGCTSGSANCVSNQAYVQLNDITSGVPGTVVSYLSVPNPSTTTQTSQTAYVNLVQGHTYQLSFPYQPVLPNSSSNFQFRLNGEVLAQTADSITVTNGTPVTQTVLTGGLRIRKITSTNALGITVIKQYKYTGAYFNSPLFNGNFDQLATTSFTFDGWGILTAYGGNLADPEGASPGLGRIITSYTANLPLPLGGVSNNAVSYNEVEEYDSDGHGNYNGKTVYDYGNELQDIVTMSMPFFKVSKEDQRALLTEKRTYKSLNGGYFLLKDEVNNYSDLDSGMTNADTVVFYTAHGLLDQASITNETIGNLNGGQSFGCFACSMFDNATHFLTNRYYYTTSRLVLKNATTTNYESTGNALSTTTSYSYQNPVHSFPTHTHMVSSTGKLEDTYTKYVPDQVFASGCSSSCTTNLQDQLAVLKQKYFPSFSSENTTYNTDWTPMIYYYVQMGKTPSDQPIFQNYANAMIAAQNSFQQTQSHYQNSIDSLMNIYNGCGSNYNSCISTYYATASPNQKAIIDLLNQNNITPHLEDSTYTNNVLMSRLQNNYLTFLPNVTQPSTVQFATLNNALENRLQFNNYDAHGNISQMQKTGGPSASYLWGYNSSYPVAQVTNATSNDIFYDSFEEGDGNSTAGAAKTGHYSHTGTYNKTLTGLDNGSYVLIYWQLSGSTWSMATTPVTVNSGSYTISISGQIDDVRFYPSTALMTTYTYDPLIGMTSSTDAKGETTYYEYDAFQRLMNIKNKDGNIIKHFDYHYQGQ